MNISHDGMTVRFKTEPKELFEVEKSGVKSNTVRIIDTYEAERIQHKPPEKIIIHYQQEMFLRTLTDVHLNYNVLGKVIAIFSWTNEKHHHVPTLIVGPHSVPVGPGDYHVSLDHDMKIKDDYHVHTKSLDEFAPILLPRTLILDLGRHRHGKSHAEFIQELFEMYLDTLTYERGASHD